MNCTWINEFFSENFIYLRMSLERMKKLSE